jgi:hypothetical protein
MIVFKTCQGRESPKKTENAAAHTVPIRIEIGRFPKSWKQIITSATPMP